MTWNNFVHILKELGLKKEDTYKLGAVALDSYEAGVGKRAVENWEREKAYEGYLSILYDYGLDEIEKLFEDLQIKIDVEKFYNEFGKYYAEVQL